jgi:hypothetical protein
MFFAFKLSFKVEVPHVSKYNDATGGETKFIFAKLVFG